MKWISVKERLPELLTEVLTLNNDEIEIDRKKHLAFDSRMKVAYTYNHKGFHEEDECCEKVKWNCIEEPTHWMPLPETPKEEFKLPPAKTDINFGKSLPNFLSKKPKEQEGSVTECVPTKTPGCSVSSCIHIRGEILDICFPTNEEKCNCGKVIIP